MCQGAGKGEGEGSFIKTTKRLCGVLTWFEGQNKDHNVEDEVEK